MTRTRSRKSLTILKLTSASSSARRTSFKASAMFCSVNTPEPRSFLKIRSNFSLRLSNMASQRKRPSKPYVQTSDRLEKSRKRVSDSLKDEGGEVKGRSDTCQAKIEMS